MKRALARVLRSLARKHTRAEWLYRTLVRPDGLEYAELLKARGEFYAIGQHCYIDPSATIVPGDRGYIRIGDNVRLSHCTLLGHDGSVNMINRAYRLRLDNVGKIDIRDNVYVGHGAIILPGVTIGPNAIVCAGSVVRSDVKQGDVVAGVPARPVGRVDLSVQMLVARNQHYPWRPLIEARTSEYDPVLEPELRRQRVEHFYGSNGRVHEVPGLTTARGAAPARG